MSDSSINGIGKIRSYGVINHRRFEKIVKSDSQAIVEF
jgi:hypothetical protein